MARPQWLWIVGPALAFCLAFALLSLQKQSPLPLLQTTRPDAAPASLVWPVAPDPIAANAIPGTMTSAPAKLTAIVQEPMGKHTATVIFLHGFGDSGAGWAPVGEQLSRYLPHVKFVFPNAPVLPITGNGGMLTPAWYDVFSASGITHKQDEPGLLRSRQQVMQLIREEVEQHNIPTERIIIGGFSQGCVLALFVALTSEHRFAGIVSLSGYLPLRTKIIDMITDESRKTPIFWGHGTADQVVKYDFGQQSVEFLQKNRYQVDFHPYPRMGHSACPEEIRDLLEYFKETLPEDLPIMAKA